MQPEKLTFVVKEKPVKSKWARDFEDFNLGNLLENPNRMP